MSVLDKTYSLIIRNKKCPSYPLWEPGGSEEGGICHLAVMEQLTRSGHFVFSESMLDDFVDKKE